MSASSGCADAPSATGPSSGSAGGSGQVQVTNLAGSPLSRVNVAIYADDSLEDMVFAGKTDDDGVFSFDGMAAGYVAVISKLPVGYVAEAYYRLEGERTQISVGAGVLTQEDMDTIRYTLGDAIMDFSVTVSDGTELRLSELLADKAAVMINFWFMGCGPCKSEFPHLQEAYAEYSDDIALIALDPLDSDDASIEAFRQGNGYTFPMGKCDPRWAQMLGIGAFPFTIVIDRYGNLSMTHLGAVPDAQIFKNVFRYYADEQYQQQFFTSIDQVPVGQ